MIFFTVFARLFFKFGLKQYKSVAVKDVKGDSSTNDLEYKMSKKIDKSTFVVYNKTRCMVTQDR